jgi:hypothetical protein
MNDVEVYESLADIKIGDAVKTIVKPEWGTGEVIGISPMPRHFSPGTPEEFQKLWGRMVRVKYPPCCVSHTRPIIAWEVPEFLRRATS